MKETIELLETSLAGLMQTEANERTQQFGYNEIVEKEKNSLVDFVLRYWGPMPWLLELTIALSLFIRHFLEAGIILALLTTNALIGFHHTRGSRRALELLRKRLAVKARVLRNANWVTVDARDIVPGDIVALGLGDLVPADAKITEGQLSIDQSALTGESLPVSVSGSGIIYSSSIVRRGEARVVVVNTGRNTYFGRTAELVKIAEPKAHQEQIMLAVVKYMMYVSFAALVLVAGDAVATHTDIVTLLTFSLIFLMGAVPVALPAVFAVVLSVGAVELAKKGALVTRLDSIEDASSVEILCLDKTGTITQNRLTVVDPTPVGTYTKGDVVKFASLASKRETGDVIDLATLEYAEALKTDFSQYSQVSYIPFEPATKRSEAIVASGGSQFRVVKGAPQVIVAMCDGVDKYLQNEVTEIVEGLSQKGYRTLAIAKSEVDNLNSLRLVGLLPLTDPPRPDSSEMIQQLKTLGVKPKMLTGDNVAIATEIARQVGIGGKICGVSDLRGFEEQKQETILEEYDGLAEIYPEDKYRIVKLLQSTGRIVGMTGDGVNDSPALKQAEVGIAVSNSTDVAKASASIVLTEPGVKVILDAIRTSRRIYQRMLTWVLNKVTKVVQFVGLLALGFFWLHDVALSVLGMVLLVFANDFVTMSLATDNVVQTNSPNVWNVRKITLASFVIGGLLVMEGAIAILIGVKYFQLAWASLQTFVMLLLVFTSQFRVLIVRERRHFWSSRPGKELIASVIATLAAFLLLGTLGIFMPALSVNQVLVVLSFSALFTLAVDIPKYWIFRWTGL